VDPHLDGAVKAAIALALVAACGSNDGRVSITAWGEEAATVGYPNQELAFADAWTLKYDHWITSLSNIELADPKTESVAFGDTTNYLADWTQAALPVDVTETSMPSGRYKFSYSFVAPSAGATKVTEVDDALVAAMITNHWNTYIEATATKGAETVKLRWGMTNPARYQYCKNGIDNTDGIAVPDGGGVEAGIFVHLDHSFWDRLGTEEASLRFDVIAAWAQNGETSLDDLEHVSVANIRGPDDQPILDEQGRPLHYDDAGLGLAKLREFIVFSTSQQAHLNGEGQCTRIPIHD